MVLIIIIVNWILKCIPLPCVRRVLSHFQSCHPHIQFTIDRKMKLANKQQTKQTPWPESASKLYGPSDRRLSTKLVPTFTDGVCHVVSVTDPYGRNLGFLDRSCHFFFQVAPHLYWRGWVDPVPDPLLLRKSGSAGNRTRPSGSVARNSDH
jgi:hypothetical protein